MQIRVRSLRTIYSVYLPLISSYIDGPQVSQPQASGLWGHKQDGGDYLTTMLHSGGNSASHIVPIGNNSVSAEPFALERTTPELWAEKPWNELALEVSGRY